MVLELFYGALNSTLGILFRLTGAQPLDAMLGLFLVASVLSAMILIIQSRVVDQSELRELKARMVKLQADMKEAQKKNNLKELNRIQREMLQDQNKMMQMSFKPMLYYFPPIIIIFSWMGSLFPAEAYIVSLPFALPMYGDRLGWLGWYVMSSFASSPVMKKILNVDP